MLEEIRIQNFALIESVSLKPGPGLNLFTGETGAGKTILIGALGILKGDRAQSDYIRKGKESASVEGFFDDEKAVLRAQEAGIEARAGEGLLLKRQLHSSGKNICYVNGQRLPLSSYRQIAQGLVDIHGQNQDQGLLKASRQGQLLDRFGDLDFQEDLVHLARLFEEQKKARALLETQKEKAASANRQMDFLSYQISEIDEKDPAIDEDLHLEEESKRLSHAEDIAELSETIRQLLSSEDGALTKIYAAKEAMDKLASYQKDYEERAKDLEEVYYNLEDLAHHMADADLDLSFDPLRLDQVEKRLQDLFFLKKKYGSSIQEVLSFRDQARAQLEELENMDQEIYALEEKLRALEGDYQLVADRVHQVRLRLGKSLATDMTARLKDLHLKEASLRIGLSAKEPGPLGTDRVDFYFSPNPGEGEMLLSKIASGGELARIMLALKTILSHVDDIEVMVFDEIDTGVGGQALVSVAKYLALLARDKQVFCVSHAPQLAAFADGHFLIKKKSSQERTVSEVLWLAESDRVEEIYRMLGGQEIEGARDQAKDFLLSAQKMKGLMASSPPNKLS